MVKTLARRDHWGRQGPGEKVAEEEELLEVAVEAEREDREGKR